MSYSHFLARTEYGKVAEELQQFWLSYTGNIVQMPINNIADKYIIAMGMTFPNLSQYIHRDRD